MEVDNNIEIFDTHLHLTRDDSLDDLVERATKVGVTRFLIAGAPVSETSQMIDRISGYPNIYAAAGIHPHEAQRFNNDLSPYRTFLKNPKIKAVGEIGLDYFYNNSEPNQQRVVFENFLELAIEFRKPAIIHCRDAFKDCFDMISNIIGERVHFVVHCFTGSKEWATRFLDIGGFLSFNGLITFKKSDNIRDILRFVPIDRMLFETDAPYLAPVPFRGKRNEPAYLRQTLERAASELDMDVKELAGITTKNGCQFFDVT